MLSFLCNLIWGSSEDRLNEFRIICSKHSAETAKLQRTVGSLEHSFSYYIKEDKQSEELPELATRLNTISQKRDAYVNVAQAASEIIQRWELFDNNEYSMIIDEALQTMHKYYNFIEQKDMRDWLKKHPLQKSKERDTKHIKNQKSSINQEHKKDEKDTEDEKDGIDGKETKVIVETVESGDDDEDILLDYTKITDYKKFVDSFCEKHNIVRQKEF
ncbi:hypothetical protein M9Y10_005063 [Tritrichomonas musculus]|uniref:Uncharacterized protein n=1 Tax=Tritrichomonas musculus TaxID=1915356 RepID=A0ABR2JL48_9EUKA